MKRIDTQNSEKPVKKSDDVIEQAKEQEVSRSTNLEDNKDTSLDTTDTSTVNALDENKIETKKPPKKEQILDDDVEVPAFAKLTLDESEVEEVAKLVATLDDSTVQGEQVDIQELIELQEKKPSEDYHDFIQQTDAVFITQPKLPNFDTEVEMAENQMIEDFFENLEQNKRAEYIEFLIQSDMNARNQPCSAPVVQYEITSALLLIEEKTTFMQIKADSESNVISIRANGNVGTHLHTLQIKVNSVPSFNFVYASDALKSLISAKMLFVDAKTGVLSASQFIDPLKLK